ncbi:hypothetical protein Q8A73_006153 [Channa argus]|nr:hypothetical protein Q8A73_006153 [Channa argus]
MPLFQIQMVTGLPHPRQECECACGLNKRGFLDASVCEGGNRTKRKERREEEDGIIMRKTRTEDGYGEREACQEMGGHKGENREAGRSREQEERGCSVAADQMIHDKQSKKKEKEKKKEREECDWRRKLGRLPDRERNCEVVVDTHVGQLLQSGQSRSPGYGQEREQCGHAEVNPAHVKTSAKRVSRRKCLVLFPLLLTLGTGYEVQVSQMHLLIHPPTPHSVLCEKRRDH